jgi:hypothetical protein
MTDCYLMIAQGSENLKKLTISLPRKSQRSDEENKAKKENTNIKKGKIAAARVEPEIAAERRMREMDTDVELDL